MLRRNKNGIAVPSSESPLPWISESYVCGTFNTQQHDVFSLDAENEYSSVVDTCERLDDAEFIAHAANYHERLAEIVRRLAFSKLSLEGEIWDLRMDAANLWAEMKGIDE